MALTRLNNQALPSDFAFGTTELDVWQPNGDITVTGSGVVDFTSLIRYPSLWEKVGTGMTESSGVFTFPSTGKWKLTLQVSIQASGGARNYMGGIIRLSSNSGSSFTNYAQGYNGGHSSGAYGYPHINAYVDVTDVSTFRAKFAYNTDAAAGIFAQSGEMNTAMIFQKIANT